MVSRKNWKLERSHDPNVSLLEIRAVGVFPIVYLCKDEGVTFFLTYARQPILLHSHLEVTFPRATCGSAPIFYSFYLEDFAVADVRNVSVKMYSAR
jgi:hypothetical protein